ncbi:GNAT family N-acetyltransferase [Pseudomonas sp. MAC6]|uniref:GNAT family N-acetyltransferase n=1 Tax=Pseudomonas sp. MAC6 TaxID=3401633 RepID=UPI003BF57FA6
MVRLSPAQYAAAYKRYLEHDAYFPLIGAVLNGTQDGVIYADCEESLNQVYVEHAFGFAQFFGRTMPVFEQALQRYLIVDKAFSCAKVRLYTPHCPDFLKVSECEEMLSWRQHFQLDIVSRTEVYSLETDQSVKGLTLILADASHVDLIERTFGVVGRFWRTQEDFASQSNAVLALVEGKAAALCYAAAVSGGRAEIDVLTLPAYRHLGLAKAVVRMFNRRCLEQNLLPLWDCFTNNIASMALCQSSGFAPLGDAYTFFTINR